MNILFNNFDHHIKRSRWTGRALRDCWTTGGCDAEESKRFNDYQSIMILIQILSKKSQALQLRLAVYLNNWRQGLGAGLSHQWGDRTSTMPAYHQKCIVQIQFSNMTLARDVTKFQCRWLSDWIRPQKSAKLQAKIPVPQGASWPLPLEDTEDEIVTRKIKQGPCCRFLL